MLGRSLLALPRLAALSGRRALHKGVDSTPPLRFISTGEKVGSCSALSIDFCGVLRQFFTHTLLIHFLLARPLPRHRHDVHAVPDVPPAQPQQPPPAGQQYLGSLPTFDYRNPYRKLIYHISGAERAQPRGAGADQRDEGGQEVVALARCQVRQQLHAPPLSSFWLSARLVHPSLILSLYANSARSRRM